MQFSFQIFVFFQLFLAFLLHPITSRVMVELRRFTRAESSFMKQFFFLFESAFVSRRNSLFHTVPQPCKKKKSLFRDDRRGLTEAQKKVKTKHQPKCFFVFFRFPFFFSSLMTVKPHSIAALQAQFFLLACTTFFHYSLALAVGLRVRLS
jgi:hypothetical protein